ncbi:nitroreductase [Marmoricola sp. OAE513]|uniref:nitroreductase family protein n=1 Tax=Marmoricola sp. OAE513 TaxID=2817894 RepID=UPI001AEB9670
MAVPELHPLLRDRRSTRQYDPTHELDDGVLVQLLEAARWSPSAGNSQPWAFLVARRGDEAHDKLVGTLSRGNTSWVPTASAVLISLFRAGADEDPTFAYSDYAAYDLGQAVAHLTVQAQASGLSVHQFAGFDHARVAELFAVPPAWQVTTGIAIGLHQPREEESRPRVRREIGEFAFSGTFGTPFTP